MAITNVKDINPSDMSINVRVGKYALACESSPFKSDIDAWINEGKSHSWINKQLDLLGEPISTKSIAKYAKHRQQLVTEKLMQDPEYAKQVRVVHGQIQDGISQVKQLDIMSKLDDVIDANATLMQRYYNDIVIETAQDLRYVTQSIIDAAKAKGALALMAQKFDNTEEEKKNNSPLAGSTVKNALMDVLKNMSETEKMAMIDNIRKGTKR